MEDFHRWKEFLPAESNSSPPPPATAMPPMLSLPPQLYEGGVGALPWRQRETSELYLFPLQKSSVGSIPGRLHFIYQKEVICLTFKTQI